MEKKVTQPIAVFVAWPYANGDIHLGHVAGAYLPADIFARYHRLRGNKVMMVSGSDTHGTPITLKAREEALEPIDIVNRYHQAFLNAWQGLGISFNLFTHTHTPNHIKVTQDFFLKLKQNGDLSIQSDFQFYDEQAAMFLPDRYCMGTCPKCGYTRARGDQCEQCGATFPVGELLNPISRISNTVPVLKETSHFFFDIGKYKDKLQAYIQKQPHWRIAVKNFSEAMVENGLQPRPITRDIPWGVSVPEPGWEDKVLYVWFDAVIGYYSGSLEWSQKIGDTQAWKLWWKNNEARSYYFIGKDNVPFHTVIWPTELMAYDSELNLPYDVPANQFLNIDGEKFSTSRGLAVWLTEMLRDFSPDAIRYYLASILPETKDANFTWEEFQTKNNSELLAAWGNLVNRVMGFTVAKFDAIIPEPGEFTEIDLELTAQIKQGFESVSLLIEGVNLREGLRETMKLVRDVNKYLDVTAPWTTIKTDRQRAGTSVFVALQAIDNLKLLLSPYIPHSSERVHKFFGHKQPLFGDLSIRQNDGEEAYNYLWYDELPEEKAGSDRWIFQPLKAGIKLAQPGPLFKIIDVESE